MTGRRRSEAWYFHGDTWRLVASAGCGETGEGTVSDSARNERAIEPAS
jgi:hypothetical protein